MQNPENRGRTKENEREKENELGAINEKVWPWEESGISYTLDGESESMWLSEQHLHSILPNIWDFSKPGTGDLLSPNPDAKDCTSRESESVDDSTQERAAKKAKGVRSRRSNAEQCRIFRERRKRVLEELRGRNSQLEQERGLLRTRIADLMNQVQALRGGGQIDLEKENELLRFEIRKHKAFVDKVLCALSSAEGICDSEKGMLLRSGIQAAVGQTVGLACISSLEPTWRNGESISLNDGSVLRTKFQYLPPDVPISQATRLNIRWETSIRNCSFKAFSKNLVYTFSNVDYLNHLFKNLEKQLGQGGSKRVAEEILHLQPSGLPNEDQVGNENDKDDIRVIRLAAHESDELEVEEAEILYISSIQEVSVFPASLLTPSENNLLGVNKSVRAAVTVQTTSSSKCFEKGTRSLRVESPFLVGAIAWPHEDDENSLRCVSVSSHPIGSKEFSLVFGHNYTIIREDGTFSDEYKARLMMHIEKGFAFIQKG